MRTEDIVKLMIQSSKHHPYKGFLSEKDTISAATELARLCREFASEGHMDEAMDIPVKQWDEVISELETWMKR